MRRVHTKQTMEKMVIKLKVLLEKSFQDLYGSKNKWIQMLHRGEKQELQQNLYVLINNSYGPLGGHVRIPNPSAILDPSLTYWEAVDDDNDPDADAVVFGRKTKHGVKINGMGHDGSGRAKSDLVNKLVKQLSKPGYWIEASGAVLQVLYKTGAPYVTDAKKIEQMFPGRNVNWMDDKGKYTRDAAAAPNNAPKTVFGKPR